MKKRNRKKKEHTTKLYNSQHSHGFTSAEDCWIILTITNSSDTTLINK
jgi:hypothetical protein